MTVTSRAGLPTNLPTSTATSLPTIPATNLATSLPTSLHTARRLVLRAIEDAVNRLDPTLRAVAGYHLGYLDAGGARIDAPGGGKALRPALALLSAEAAGAAPERGVAAAVAVELVHNFSLLHDDIMDGDTERRHRATAWTVFGNAAAILAGDALLALAGEVLLEDPSPAAGWAHRCLTAATQRLIAGQSADIGFERRLDVSLDECLRMASDKTGALLSCAAALGAILVDADPDLVFALAEFGACVGLAFQVVDDLLGIWGRPEATGKPVLADLRIRKKSVPVVAALTSGTPAGDALRTLYVRPEPLDGAELVRAARLVEESGGRARAEDEAQRQFEAAERHLEAASPPPAVAAELRDLARLVLGRDR